MAELNPAAWLQNAGNTHNANTFRLFMALLAGGGEGVMPASGVGTLAVSQRGAGANMSVDVAPGIVSVFGDENLMQGLYGMANDATKNVAIATADATNPRRDIPVARVRDAFYSGATNAWDLFVVQGTPAASPVDPAMPNNAVALARVAVAAGAGSIVNANITDLRAYTPLGWLIGNSARRAGTLYGPFSQEPAFKSVLVNGQPFYDQDTLRALIHDGTAFRPLGTAARSWTIIDEITLAADGAISFQNIPATYTHLRISGTVRGASASVFQRLLMRVNNDGSAIHDSFGGLTIGGGWVDQAANAQTSCQFGEIAGSTSTANYYSHIEITVEHYATTDRMKGGLCRVMHVDPASRQCYFNSGWRYRSTNAVNRLDLFHNAAGTNFKAGSRAVLEAIR